MKRKNIWKKICIGHAVTKINYAKTEMNNLL